MHICDDVTSPFVRQWDRSERGEDSKTQGEAGGGVGGSSVCLCSHPHVTSLPFLYLCRDFAYVT